MKKSILFTVLGLMLTSVVLDSCKKGEGDPFLSLHSRKGRLAGDWKMGSGSKDHYKSNSMTIDNTYDGTNVTSVQTINPFPAQTSTSAFTLEWKIEKDGTFESIEVQGSGTNQQTTTLKGRWNFTGSVGDAKKKDHVIFYIDSQTIANSSGSTTDTFTGDQNSMVVELNTLKNKELVTKTTDTDSNSGSPVESTSEYHFAQ